MKSLRNNIIEYSHIKWGFDSLIKTSGVTPSHARFILQVGVF